MIYVSISIVLGRLERPPSLNKVGIFERQCDGVGEPGGLGGRHRVEVPSCSTVAQAELQHCGSGRVYTGGPSGHGRQGVFRMAESSHLIDF